MPKVSIVIPTYNRPLFLERLLNSIEKQTFRDYEVIVVDDNSPNKKEIERILHRYKKSLPSLIYLPNEKNYGAPYSRNSGIYRSSGELIALVDDDDEWMPAKLEKQINYFAQTSDAIGFVYTWAKVYKDNKTIREEKSTLEGNILKELLITNFIPSPSVLAKKEALLKAGLFDLEMPSCQDWDMWVKLCAAGYQCGVVPSFESIYHKHDDESIGSSPKALEGYQIFYDKHLQLYRTFHPKIFYKRVIKNYFLKIKSKKARVNSQT